MLVRGLIELKRYNRPKAVQMRALQYHTSDIFLLPRRRLISRSSSKVSSKVSSAARSYARDITVQEQ